jgi:hypothetical protein
VCHYDEERDGDMVECTVCEQWVHCACAGLSAEQAAELAFVCNLSEHCVLKQKQQQKRSAGADEGKDEEKSD